MKQAREVAGLVGLALTLICDNSLNSTPCTAPSLATLCQIYDTYHPATLSHTKDVAQGVSNSVSLRTSLPTLTLCSPLHLQANWAKELNQSMHTSALSFAAGLSLLPDGSHSVPLVPFPVESVSIYSPILFKVVVVISLPLENSSPIPSSLPLLPLSLSLSLSLSQHFSLLCCVTHTLSPKLSLSRVFFSLSNGSASSRSRNARTSAPVDYKDTEPVNACACIWVCNLLTGRHCSTPTNGDDDAAALNLALKSWEDALNAQSLDSLTGDAISWSWLPAACNALPCVANSTAILSLAFNASTYTAQVQRSLVISACTGNTQKTCQLLQAQMELSFALATAPYTGATAIVKLNAHAAGDWNALTDSPPFLQGHLWARGPSALLLDMDLRDGTQFYTTPMATQPVNPTPLETQLARAMLTPTRLHGLDASTTTAWHLRPVFLHALHAPMSTECYGQSSSGLDRLCRSSLECADPNSCPSIPDALLYEVAHATPACSNPTLVPEAFGARATVATAVTTDAALLQVVGVHSQTWATIRCAEGDLLLDLHLSTQGNHLQVTAHSDLVTGNDQALWAFVNRIPANVSGHLRGLLFPTPAASSDQALFALPYSLNEAAEGGALIPVTAATTLDTAPAAAVFNSLLTRALDTGNTYANAMLAAHLGPTVIQPLLTQYAGLRKHPHTPGAIAYVAQRLGLQMYIDHTGQRLVAQIGLHLTATGARLDASVDFSRVQAAVADNFRGYIDYFSFPEAWEEYYYENKLDGATTAQNDLLVAFIGRLDNFAANPNAWALDAPLQWHMQTVSQQDFDRNERYYPVFLTVAVKAVTGNVDENAVHVRYTPNNCDNCPRDWPMWWSEEMFCVYWNDYWWWWWDFEWTNEFLLEHYRDNLEYLQQYVFEYFAVSQAANVFDIVVDQANVQGALAALLADIGNVRSTLMSDVAHRFDATLGAWTSDLDNVLVYGRSSYNDGFLLTINSVSLHWMSMSGDRIGTRDVVGTARLQLPTLLVTNSTMRLDFRGFDFDSHLTGNTLATHLALPVAKDMMHGISRNSSYQARLDIHSYSDQDIISIVDAEVNVRVALTTDTNTTLTGAIDNRASSNDASSLCKNDPTGPLSTATCYTRANSATSMVWSSDTDEPHSASQAFLHDLLSQSLVRLVPDALQHVEAPAPGLVNTLTNLSSYAADFGNVSLWALQPLSMSNLEVATTELVCPAGSYAKTLGLSVSVNGRPLTNCTMPMTYGSLEAASEALNNGLADCDLDWLLDVVLTKVQRNQAKQLCGQFTLRTLGTGGAYAVTVSTYTQNSPVFDGQTSFQRVATAGSLTDAAYLYQMLYQPDLTRYYKPRTESLDLSQFAPDDLAPAALRSLLPARLPAWRSHFEACTVGTVPSNINATVAAGNTRVRPATTAAVVSLHQCVNVSYGIVYQTPDLAGAETHDNVSWYRLETNFTNATQLQEPVSSDGNEFVIVVAAERRVCSKLAGEFCEPGALTITPLSANVHVVLPLNTGATVQSALLAAIPPALPAPFASMINVSVAPANPRFADSVAQVVLDFDGVQEGENAWVIPTVMGVQPVTATASLAYFHPHLYKPFFSAAILHQADVRVDGVLAAAFDGPGDIGIIPSSYSGCQAHTNFNFAFGLVPTVATTTQCLASLRQMATYPEYFEIEAAASGTVTAANVTINVVEQGEQVEPELMFSVNAAGSASDSTSLQALLVDLGTLNATFQGPTRALFERLSLENATELCEELDLLADLDASIRAIPALQHPLAMVDESLLKLYNLVFEDKIARLQQQCSQGQVQDLRQLCDQFASVFGINVCQAIVLRPEEDLVTVDLAFAINNATLPAGLVFETNELFHLTPQPAEGNLTGNQTLPLGEGETDHLTLVYSGTFHSQLVFNFTDATLDTLQLRNTTMKLAVNYDIKGDQLLYFGMLPIQFERTSAQLSADLHVHAAVGAVYELEALNASSHFTAEPSMELAPDCFVDIRTDSEYLLSNGARGIELEQILCGDGGFPWRLTDMLHRHDIVSFFADPARLVAQMQRLSEVGPRVLYQAGGAFSDGVELPLVQNDYDAHITKTLAEITGPQTQQALTENANRIVQVIQSLNQTILNDVYKLRQIILQEITDALCKTFTPYLLSGCPPPPVAMPDSYSFQLCADVCTWDFVFGKASTVQHTHVHNNLGGLRFLHLQSTDTITSDVSLSMPVRLGLTQHFGLTFQFLSDPAVIFSADLGINDFMTGRLAFLGADLHVDAGLSVMFGVGATSGTPPSDVAAARQQARGGAEAEAAVADRRLRRSAVPQARTRRNTVEVVDDLLHLLEGTLSSCTGLQFSDGCRTNLTAVLEQDEQRVEDILHQIDVAEKSFASINMPDLTDDLPADLEALRTGVVTPIFAGYQALRTAFGDVQAVVDSVKQLECEISLPKEGSVKPSYQAAGMLKIIRGGLAKTGQDAAHAVQGDGTRLAVMLLSNPNITSDELHQALTAMGGELINLIVTDLVTTLLEMLDPEAALPFFAWTLLRDTHLASEVPLMVEDLVKAFEDDDWFSGGKGLMELLMILSPNLARKCQSIEHDLEDINRDTNLRRRRSFRTSAIAESSSSSSNMPDEFMLKSKQYFQADARLGFVQQKALSTNLPYLEGEFSLTSNVTIGHPLAPPVMHTSLALHLGAYFTYLQQVLWDKLEKYLKPAREVYDILNTHLELLRYLVGRAWTIAELLSKLKASTHSAMVKAMITFMDRFDSIEKDLMKVENLVYSLSQYPAVLDLGNFSLNYALSLLNRTVPSSPIPQFKNDTTPDGIKNMVTQQLSEFLARGINPSPGASFCITFPFLHHLETIAEDLLLGNEVPYDLVSLQLPSFSLGSSVPFGPYIVWSVPLVMVEAALDIGLTVQPIHLSLPFSALTTAVASRDPAQLLERFGMRVKDDAGRQLYPLSFYVGFGVQVDVSVLIFKGSVGLGLRGTISFGLKDVEGTGILEVADLVALVKAGGNLLSLVTGVAELDAFLTAGIEACIPIPFHEMCWTVLKWNHYWVLYRKPFWTSQPMPVISSAGAINPAAALFTSDSVLTVQVTTVGSGLTNVQLRDTVSPGSEPTDPVRSRTLKAGTLSFAGNSYNGKAFNILVAGLTSTLRLPAGNLFHVLIDLEAYPTAPQLAFTAAGVAATGTFSLLTQSNCGTMLVQNVHVASTFAVSRLWCPVTIESISSNNVTLRGQAGSDFVAAHPLTVSDLQSLDINVEDTAFEMTADALTSSAGLNVVLSTADFISALRLLGSNLHDTTFIITSVRPETSTQVVGQTQNDNFVVPAFDTLAAPVLLNGGPGEDGCTLTLTAVDGSSTNISTETVAHEVNNSARYAFTRNIEVRLFNVHLTAGAHYRTFLNSVRAGQMTLLNLVASTQSTSEHRVAASALGAQLKYVVTGSGSHDFLVGADGSLVDHAGTIMLTGDATPDQTVTLRVQAQSDPRTLQYELRRNMLTVVDTASPAEDIFRLSFAHVDLLVLELNGQLTIDDELDVSQYGTEVHIIMANHTDNVPEEFIPTRRVWRNDVTVLGTNAPILIQGMVHGVTLGPNPCVTSLEPGCDCSAGGRWCLTHPLSALRAPVIVEADGSTGWTSLVLQSGSAGAAPDQFTLVQENRVYQALPNGTAWQVRAPALSTRFCAGLWNPALCAGAAPLRLGANTAVRLLGGGGADRVFVLDTPMPISLDLRSGEDSLHMQNVTNVTATLGEGYDEVTCTFPCSGAVDLGADMNHVRLAPAGNGVIQSADTADPSAIRFFEANAEATSSSLVVSSVVPGDDIEVVPHIEPCAACAQQLASAPLPAGLPDPVPSFSPTVTMADILVAPTSSDGHTHVYVVDGCNNMPFRAVVPRAAGIHRVELPAALDLTCAISFNGLTYQNQTNALILSTSSNPSTVGASGISDLHLIADEDAWHVRSASQRSFLRVRVAHVAQVRLEGPVPAQALLEMGEVEPMTNTMVNLTDAASVSASRRTMRAVAATPPRRHIHVRGTTGPTLVTGAAFDTVVVGTPSHPANPLDPLSHLYSVLVLHGSAPVIVAVPGAVEDYAPDQKLQVAGACVGVPDGAGGVRPASDLLQRYPTSTWLCDQLEAIGLSELCNTTCPLSVVQPAELLIQTGGGRDELHAVGCRADLSLSVVQGGGKDIATISNCTGPMTVDQGPASDDVALRAPLSSVTVNQGNLVDNQSHVGNNFYATFGSPVVMDSANTIKAGDTVILYAEPFNDNDLVELHYDPSLPAVADNATCEHEVVHSGGGFSLDCVSNTVYCLGPIDEDSSLALNCEGSSNVTIQLTLTSADLDKTSTIQVHGGANTTLDVSTASDLSVWTRAYTDYGQINLGSTFKFLVSQLTNLRVSAQKLDMTGTALASNVALIGESQLQVGDIEALDANALLHNCIDCNLSAAFWNASGPTVVLSGSATALSTGNPLGPLSLNERCLASNTTHTPAMPWLLASQAQELGFTAISGCPVTVNGTRRVGLAVTDLTGVNVGKATAYVAVQGLGTAVLSEPAFTQTRTIQADRLVVANVLTLEVVSSATAGARPNVTLAGNYSTVVLACDAPAPSGVALHVAVQAMGGTQTPTKATWAAPFCGGSLTALEALNFRVAGAGNASEALALMEITHTPRSTPTTLVTTDAHWPVSWSVGGFEALEATATFGTQLNVSTTSDSGTSVFASAWTRVTSSAAHNYVTATAAATVNFVASGGDTAPDLVLAVPGLVTSSPAVIGGRVLLVGCQTCEWSPAVNNSWVAAVPWNTSQANGTVQLSDASAVTLTGACVGSASRTDELKLSAWLRAQLSTLGVTEAAAAAPACPAYVTGMALMRTTTTKTLSGTRVTRVAAQIDATHASAVHLNASGNVTQQGAELQVTTALPPLSATRVLMGAAAHVTLSIASETMREAALQLNCLQSADGFTGTISATLAPSTSGAANTEATWKATHGCSGTLGVGADGVYALGFGLGHSNLVLDADWLNASGVVSVNHRGAVAVALPELQAEVATAGVLKAQALSTPTATRAPSWSMNLTSDFAGVVLPAAAAADVMAKPQVQFLSGFSFVTDGSTRLASQVRFWPADQTLIAGAGRSDSDCLEVADCSVATWAEIEIDGRGACHPEQTQAQCRDHASATLAFAVGQHVACHSNATHLELGSDASQGQFSVPNEGKVRRLASACFALTFLLIAGLVIWRPAAWPVALGMYGVLIAIGSALGEGLDARHVFVVELRHVLRDYGAAEETSCGGSTPPVAVAGLVFLVTLTIVGAGVVLYRWWSARKQQSVVDHSEEANSLLGGAGATGSLRVVAASGTQGWLAFWTSSRLWSVALVVLLLFVMPAAAVHFMAAVCVVPCFALLCGAVSAQDQGWRVARQDPATPVMVRYVHLGAYATLMFLVGVAAVTTLPDGAQPSSRGRWAVAWLLWLTVLVLACLDALRGLSAQAGAFPRTRADVSVPVLASAASVLVLGLCLLGVLTSSKTTAGGLCALVLLQAMSLVALSVLAWRAVPASGGAYAPISESAGSTEEVYDPVDFQSSTGASPPQPAPVVATRHSAALDTDAEANVSHLEDSN
ncbi:uncharacterized protein MONBRDRAFT_29887 [Monosiga brevicollis MX1]|uniref:Uncharacterized protein n=1 Tax=Monosiga brevicollis TaxID=81824 RepID=A9VCF2_MONBE|nr:uncharacterized protein MONBRDRAFT_29887 [Monosiga brevicollis MX1]EDQ84774.1 predicted protein [Monosiga brevicollis MX1]|eukprot:XP_001750424.1 hypothetical protein [Monosiga brevicollis MX1]